MSKRPYLIFRVSALAVLVLVCASHGVAEAAPRQDELVKADNYVYLCTFNVYKLGSVAPKYDALGGDSDADDSEEDPSGGIPQRIKNLANVLAVGKFDLVAFQEVTDGAKGEAAMADLVAQLKSEHGLTYQFFLSDYIGQGLMREAIAFMWNPALVTSQPWPGESKLAINIAIPGRDLVRTRWKAGDFDFTLISAHLAWGNEDDRNAGYDKIEHIFNAGAPSQYSSDPDIVVLGDFNRFGKGFDSVKELPYNAAKFLVPNVTFFDPEFSTRKEVSKTSIADKGVKDDEPQFVSTTVAKNKFVYDMIFISKDVEEEYDESGPAETYGTDWGIIHFDEVGGFGYQAGAETLVHDDLKVAYSDHRPLWMRFKTNAGHSDEGAPATVDEYVGTEHGSRFHLPSCWTMRDKVDLTKWATRPEAAADRPPCGICKP